MGPKAGVFCHNGLGDGIIGLVLSNNLHLNGWHVETYQNTIGSMQNWVPHLPVIPYPASLDEIERLLHRYDWFFIFHNGASEFVEKLIQETKRRFSDQSKVLYFYPSSRIVNERYYQDARIDPEIPVADNLRHFCEKILHLPKSTRSNGFIPPPELRSRHYKQRVVIHPTSSRPGKNWSSHKYVKLALHLREEGYEPVWIIEAREKAQWAELERLGFEMPHFGSLDAVARYIYESGYLLGNDSGLGHLASFLGVPTLTVTRRKRLARLWAPSFAPGLVITPGSWVPNIRWFRLRDRHWQKFVSLGRVARAFSKLVADAP